jgi:two-component system cell cycle response regulator DivK
MLVVDDDPANARLVAALLAAEGTTDVRIAHSAEEALAIIRTAAIRVLIVDLLLPGLSGLALVERLKADGSTCHIAAIAVTASSAAGIEAEAMRSGCAGFVEKPIDFDKLLGILSASLAEQAARGPNPSLPSNDW